MKYDITDDYEEYKGEKWFYKTLGKSHTLDMYVSSSEEESESESEDSYYDDNEYISFLKTYLVKHFFIEKLEGTLEDLLDNVEDLKYRSLYYHVYFK